MIRAAFAAAKALKRDFGEVEHLQVSEKGPGDFVSHADIKAERTLRAELLNARDRNMVSSARKAARPRATAAPLDRRPARRHHQLPARRAALRHLDRPRARGRDHGRRRSTTGLRRVVLGREGQWRLLDTPNARSRRLRVSGRKDPARALVATGIPHIGKEAMPPTSQARGRDRATAGHTPLGRRGARPRLRGGRALRRSSSSGSRRGTSRRVSCWCARPAA